MIIGSPGSGTVSYTHLDVYKRQQCGGYMVEKGNKLACADPQCGYVTELKKEKQAN